MIISAPETRTGISGKEPSTKQPAQRWKPIRQPASAWCKTASRVTTAISAPTPTSSAPKPSANGSPQTSSQEDEIRMTTARNAARIPLFAKTSSRVLSPFILTRNMSRRRSDLRASTSRALILILMGGLRGVGIPRSPRRGRWFTFWMRVRWGFWC